MNNDKLREIATKIITLPEHYRLVMEDSIPQGNEQDRCFIWEDLRQGDDKIEISLDLGSGELTALSIDNAAAETEETAKPGLIAEAEAAADAFVAKHASDPAEYTWKSVIEKCGKFEITYCREASGLPLPDTGCKLIVDGAGNVIGYRLKERSSRKVSEPKWPAAIKDKEAVRQQIIEQCQLRLSIVCLHSSLYEFASSDVEQDYRLVYEPITNQRWIDAVTGHDLYEPEHYVMPPSRPIVSAESDFNETGVEDDVALNSVKPSWEQLAGVQLEHYELVKESDDGERVKYLYQLQKQEEEQLESDELSVDAYMRRKWGDSLQAFKPSSIIVQVEKATDRLAGFHRMDSTQEGQPALSREQCWKRAERFLNRVFPDYRAYFQLEVDQKQGEKELREREFFYLPVYISGIPVSHERAMISVSTVSGEICSYMGVSYEMIQQLASRQFQPLISPDAALARYIEQLKLKLKWHLDDSDPEAPRFRLLYEPAVHITDEQGEEKPLRFIDAVTGEWIWGK